MTNDAPKDDFVGRVPSHGATSANQTTNAGSGGPAYSKPPAGVVPSCGTSPSDEDPRRLRRLHRVWPDRDGNISYLVTICVEGRFRVLANEIIFDRFTEFLIDTPSRYHWFPRRFVIMPDHIHLIAHMGHDAVRLGQWIKALKAVVGGLTNSEERPVRAPGLQVTVPDRVSPLSATRHEFTRIKRSWRWQIGFHDHKFRTPESESRKWEYICLNPVRYCLVKRPEDWPYGGEIFYGESRTPTLVRGTPPLLETGLLIGPPDERKSRS